MREALGHQGGKKAERFKLLMQSAKKKLELGEKRTLIKEKKAMLEEKKVGLEEKKVKIAANAKAAKMLSLKVESLNADARMIMNSSITKC